MKILRVVFYGEEPPHFTITNAFKFVFEEVDTIYWDDFNNTGYGHLNELLRNLVRSHKYDAVFMQIQTAGVIHPETARIMSENSIVFNWTGDVRNDLTAYTEIGEFVVTLFTNKNDVRAMRLNGFLSDYLQTGYDHKHYFRQNRERLNNIAFCANYYSDMNFPLTHYRSECARALKIHFPENFNLYGQNWDRVGLKADSLYADNSKEALLYNVSSLALSVSHYNYSQYFSDRLLREMACGCCVLSHRYEDCDKDFEDGKNIVFFDNTADLVEKARYYFNKPEEARAIGDRAAEYVSENYNWVAVITRFKQMIKKYKNGDVSPSI